MNFKAFPTKVEGVRIINSSVFEDSRGFFETAFHVEQFKELGLPTEFPQDNISTSFQGALRGMHIQRENPQGKLIRCVSGVIWDVWVDLRPDSPTFKKWECLSLRSTASTSVYLPPGLAHGFFCVTPVATVHYKCTTLYDKESDGGIIWNDPETAIKWPFDSEFTPLISGKDANLPTMAEYLAME